MDLMQGLRLISPFSTATVNMERVIVRTRACVLLAFPSIMCTIFWMWAGLTSLILSRPIVGMTWVLRVLERLM